MQNVLTEFATNNSASLLFILGFIVNTIATVVLKNTTSRNVVIVILKTIVGALEKAPKVGILLLAIGSSVTQVGCVAAIPKPSSPCPGLYCVEWSGNEVGLPGSALICAKTDAELQSTVRELTARYPKSTVRKVDSQ